MNKYISIPIIILLFTITAVKSYQNYEFTELNKYTKDYTVEEIIKYEIDKYSPKSCSDMPKGVNLMILGRYKKSNMYEVVECTRENNTIKEHICGSYKVGKHHAQIRCPGEKTEPVPEFVKDYGKKQMRLRLSYERDWRNYKVYYGWPYSDVFKTNPYLLFDGKTVRNATDEEAKLLWFLSRYSYY